MKSYFLVALSIVLVCLPLQIDIQNDGKCQINNSTALSITLPDTVVDDDWALLPPGTTVNFPGDSDPHTIGVDAFPTINSAFAMTAPGATIYVAPGTYTTNTIINKSVKIIGSGSGNNPAVDTVVQNNTADIFNVQASNVSLSSMFITALGASWRGIYIIGTISNLTFSDLHITRCYYNGYFQYTSVVDNVKFLNCTFDFAQSSLFYFQTNSGTRQNCVVTNLLYDGCVFTDSLYGLYVYQPPLNAVPAMRPNDFRNITVRNSRFERLTYKAVYAERLQDALFDGITMVDCGTDPTYANPNGININLKYADFSNITIQNSTFRRCGLTEKTNSACLYIEGRADNAYAGNPATLTNVNIINCIIDESTRGLVEGFSINVNVERTQIYNCTMGLTTMGVVNFTMNRCVVIGNNRELLPFFDILDTYGVAIAGRLYPSTILGPFFGATNATIQYCVFCGHQNAGLANADEVLNVRQFGFIPSSIDARYNWWGANDGPSSFGPGHGDPIGPATITYAPWFTMNTTVSNSQIVVGGQTSTITVRLTNLSDGSPASSNIIDGVYNVTLWSTLGVFNTGMMPVSLPLVNGQAQATFFSPSTIGLATISVTTDCNPNSQVAQVTVRVIGNVVLEVKKTARRSSLSQDENAAFVITVTNRGNVPATNVTMSDVNPRELEFVSASPSGSRGSGSIIFDLGTLQPGSSETFEVTFKLSQTADLSNGNKLLLINQAIATGYNFYNNFKVTSSDTAVVAYSGTQQTPDMEISTVWKGLETKTSTTEAGTKVELDVTAIGCHYPCKVNIDWGDSTCECKTQDDCDKCVCFDHTWAAGQYTVTITAVDEYGKTRYVIRKITVK